MRKRDQTHNDLPLYLNKDDKSLHMSAVRQLALNTGASEERIRELYEIVLRRLRKEAKIDQFLPLLVSKKVEHLLAVRKKIRTKS